MAVKKSASATPEAKAKDAPAPKSKAVAVKTKSASANASAAKKETAPKTLTSVAPKKAAAAPKSSAPTPKKSPAAAVTLTSTQTELLGRVHGAGDPGYRSEKKNEQRTLDALLDRKLIKRGAKHKESGHYHYQVSSTGKKHVDSNPGSAAESAPATGGTP